MIIALGLGIAEISAGTRKQLITNTLRLHRGEANGAA
jgi:hypothetical protein